MARLKRSQFVVDVSLEHGGEPMKALYHTMTAGFVLIPERAWSYALSDPVAPADTQTLDVLRESGFLLPEAVDEALVYENWKEQQVHDFSALKSKVLVTRKCNNRCRYCILDPEPAEMTAETARAMDRFYIETMGEKNPETVRDDYLGGEPLLHPAVIMESAARRYYYCLGKGISYGFCVTTNGTLLAPDLVRAMRQVGLDSVRVSMAGPAAVHDRLRPSAGNGKTYDTILKNLHAVSGLIPLSIECQYDSGSLDFLSIPEMLDDFTERGLRIENIVFTPILPRRGENPYDAGPGDPRIHVFLTREAGKRGFPVHQEAPSSSCMADFRSLFVFDTDGSIIPCPSLQGGERAYGHVTTGVDFVAESQMRRRNLPEKCLRQCALLPLCRGGCRLQALIGENDFDGIDCRYDTYRFLLEHHIREKAAAALPDKRPVALRQAA